ncbi:MAG: triphosphoribosyl-dephospho-CoA synthase [Betaproteobacteria bacterium]|nr:triphosphoribosyl-dephospho-CoA synthase [Betaproteobacteria bacterium]
MKATDAFALEPTTVAAAIWDACVTDVRAFKPGNVSIASPGHGMRADDFIASADAMAAAIAAPAADVGQRILRAIEATHAVVPVNTNLGIVLLCAPLAHAATSSSSELILRERLRAVLAGLNVDDAGLAYRAIRLAEPGGLGRSDRHDVVEVPHVTLREAMDEARDRDRIAHQYVTDYGDIFETGLPALQHGLARWRSREWAAVHAYLIFLARYPDSHVARKHGGKVAAAVSLQARDLSQALGRASDPAREMPALEAFDRQLKARSINPGTSADMTVATLVAMDLEDSLDQVSSERVSSESRAGVGTSG